MVAKSVSVCGVGGASDSIAWVRLWEGGQNGVPDEEGNPRLAKFVQYPFMIAASCGCCAESVPGKAAVGRSIRYWISVACAAPAFSVSGSAEPAFARVFYIHMPAAGPRAVDRLDAGTSLFADLNQKWHQRAREHHPEWPSVPSEAYLALAGATIELVRSMVRAGWTDDLPKLEEALMALHLAVLAARPWPPGT